MAYIKHLVIEEDTVQYLAHRYLEDSSRWLEIVLLNNLEYPFIVNEIRNENTSEKVIAVGEYITIPIEEDFSNLTVQEARENYDRALGEDLSLMMNDLTVDLESGNFGEFHSTINGDVATVKGLNNLKQAIVIRLATPYGSLIHHPNYGSNIHYYVGQRDTYENREKLKIEVERTIRSDRRVGDVSIESLTVKHGVVRIDVLITPITIAEILSLSINFDESGIIDWT